VQRYIRIGIEEGAKLVAGGDGLPEGVQAGWFVRPTLFTNVRNDMTIAREQIFGPVLSIIAYQDEEDAIAIAAAIPPTTANNRDLPGCLNARNRARQDLVATIAPPNWACRKELL
jgi:acyl-CoA reductase-like NAD-dependent aldehyde dehydrogenase